MFSGLVFMFLKRKDEDQDFTKYLIYLQKVSKDTLLHFFYLFIF